MASRERIIACGRCIRVSLCKSVKLQHRDIWICPDCAARKDAFSWYYWVERNHRRYAERAKRLGLTYKILEQLAAEKVERNQLSREEHARLKKALDLRKIQEYATSDTDKKSG